jgi:LysM repeat protein/ABC-type branched-subunit amino acid transport system substrate-binding protein
MASGQFQPAEVVRSDQRASFQGKYYYIHTVKKGQTLFSICRVYGVSQEVVLNENPGLDPAALAEGQAIRIPDFTQVTVPESRREAKQEDNRFYYHTVRPGQTVYFLSRKYDVPEEWIYEFNPAAREKLSAGQRIIIPKRKEFEAILSQGDTGTYRYYTVREKDTLYSLCQEYGVSLDRIIMENPVLQEGLRAGTVLRIPVIAADTVAAPVDSAGIPFDESVCGNWIVDKKNFKVALLLPFYSNISTPEPIENGAAVNQEMTEDPLKRQQDQIGKSFVEFYEGFLLSLDTLRELGYSVSLHVYDTEKDTLKVKKIIQQLYTIQPDLIIGPVYSEDVKLVGEFARNQGINLVSPLSTRMDLVTGNPNVIQVVPTEETENAYFARYISQFKNNPVILFRDDDSASMRASWKFKQELLPYFDTDSLGNPLNFTDYKLNDSTMRKLSKILKNDAENIIIIASENEPDVASLIGKLHLMSRIYKMSLFGVPAWQVWKSIDIKYFHAMQLQYYTPFHIDYNNAGVIRFMKKCREVYGFEPYEITPKGYNFCMLGYDIGMFFISALGRYGYDFTRCMNTLGMDMLLTHYDFIKTGEGYSNRTIHIIRYKPDYTLEKVTVPPAGETISE